VENSATAFFHIWTKESFYVHKFSRKREKNKENRKTKEERGIERKRERLKNIREE
jgi:hypothetical protein